MVTTHGVSLQTLLESVTWHTTALSTRSVHCGYSVHCYVQHTEGTQINSSYTCIHCEPYNEVFLRCMPTFRLTCDITIVCPCAQGLSRSANLVEDNRSLPNITGLAGVTFMEDNVNNIYTVCLTASLKTFAGQLVHLVA